MEITETRVKMVAGSADRLKAYCSVTIDGCFVIRDLKVIDGSNGLFVAMPSRKLTARCSSCGSKNHLRAQYCNECGKKLTDTRSFKNSGRSKLHADVAHPINGECREFIQSHVIEEYEAEVERSRQPGYVADSSFDEYGDDPSPYDEMIRELRDERQTDQERTPVHEDVDWIDEPVMVEAEHVEDDRTVQAEEQVDAEPEPDSAPPEPASARSEAGSDETADDAFGAGLS